MKKSFYLFAFLVTFVSCNDDNSQGIDLTIYNSELSILENIDNGVSIEELLDNGISVENILNVNVYLSLEIISLLGTEALYGLEYKGGYIFHFDENDGSLIVATDYSQIGNVAWGDTFELDTSIEIGSGDLNTQQIVEGNLNDNSSNGFEHGNDNYVFKIVSDLEFNGFNDWFVPSRDSMAAIYSNVHSLGFGNFNQNIIYWSSTKIGYQPYVMGFNFDSWGGEPFLGNCASPNGVMIARKVN
jgi:hypothetical protein